MIEPLGSMQRFSGRVALITGAASGIGRASAIRFAAEGASLALCDLNGEMLDAVAAGLDLGPGRVMTRALDVSDGAALEAFVVDGAQRFGRLDVLVNNAGVGAFGHVDEISPETWRRVFAINVESVFFGARAALPFLRETHGSIVNTASISGLFADPGLAAYCAAKASVVNLTRQMAVDHADDGVRVNCVCPGGVASPMLKGHMRDAGFMAEYEATVPMRRLAEPEEIAAAIAFLASADASYITGVSLVIDGGVTAKTGQPNFDRLYRERGWDQKALGR